MEAIILYRCRYCHKACNNSDELEEHEKIHKEEIFVTCKDCGEHLENKDFLTRHSCTASNKGNGFSCNICEKMYVTDSELQKHIQEHCHGGEKFQCKLCNGKFCSSYDHQRHKEVHHPTRKYMYMCPVCAKRFESKLSLECHLQKHDNSTSGTHDTPRVMPSSDMKGVAAMSPMLETFFCNVCGQTFSQEGHFQQHLDRHFQRKSYECDICNSRFVGPFFLKHHMEVHSGTRPYVCSQCGTGYRQKDLLMKHFVIHGVPKMENRIEQLQEASSREEVKQAGMSTTHVENDTNALIDKNFDQEADTDGVDFIDLLQSCDSEEHESNLHEDLLSHISPHSEHLHPKQLKENSLPVLGEGGDQFLLPLNQGILQGCSAGTVRREKRKIFPCDLCNKVFKVKAHWQRHRRIHTGEMPYECRVCKRKFKWRSSLVTHSCFKSRKHRGESNSITSHISVVDSEEQLTEHRQGHGAEYIPEANEHVDVTKNVKSGFLCSLCGENFATDILLQSHVSVHDGLKHDPASSETHMVWQNDRADPLERSRVVTRTLPAEQSQSLSPMTDAGTDQLSCSTNEIVHQKQSQGSRKWAISWRTRQPRLSMPSRNPGFTPYNTMKEKKRKVFVCEFCSKVSLSQNHYLRHRRLHTGEKPFECDRCDRKFMWKSSLDSHKNSHEKKDQHSTNTDVVSVIGAERSDKAVQEQPDWPTKVKEERDSNKAFICLQCGKSFASEPELHSHVSTHEAANFFARSAPKTGTGVAPISNRAKDVTQQRTVSRPKRRKCQAGKLAGTASEADAVSKQNRKNFVCEYCSKVFNNPSRYQRHLPFHTGEMPFHCNLCNKKYKWRSSLDSHKKSHDKKKGISSHNTVPFIETAQSGKLVQEPLEGIPQEDDRSVGDKIFVCVVCGMDFATEMELQSHKSVHKDTKYHAISAPRTDTGMAQLSGREKDAQQKNSEKSKRQKKPSTKRASNSISETDTVHEQNSKKFVCEVCSKVFHVKHHYHRHKRIHTEEMPFKCDQCDKVFKWRSSFDSHKKSHIHNRKKGRASSSDYVSLIANELTQEHSETVLECNEDEGSPSTTLKLFICPQCGKDFVSDLQLQIHMFIHGDENYLQTHAGLRVGETNPDKSSGPVLHMSQHSTARNPPHNGQLHRPGRRERLSTGKSGGSSTTSETGSRREQKKKNFTCEVCGKAFLSQNHYWRHMPVHTGEMPFECDRCNRKFKWRSSLDSHKKSHDKKDASITDIEFVSFIDSDED